MSASWYAVRNVKDAEAEVSIYDEIGLFGVTAKEFSNSIKSLGNRRITLRIHSPGGEIFEGNAIYNALRRHLGGVDVAIDGLAASMATVIAMAGQKRSMAENAMFMIHNPWTFSAGESKDLRRGANLLDDLKESIVSVYASRTGLSRDKLGEMMDEETWLTAKEAKELGFVTEITEPFNMKNSFERFDISRFPKRPSNFMAKKTELNEEAAPEVIETTEVIPAPEAKAEVSAPEAKPEFDFEAKISAIESSYNAVISAKDAEIASLRGQLDKAAGSLSRLEASKGLAPAGVVPIVPEASEQKSPLDIYMSLQGEEATAFYKKHEAILSKLVVKKV